MSIDREDFAEECVRQGSSKLKVHPHYMLAVAQLRSGISDQAQNSLIGPFRLSQTQWDANKSDDEFGFHFSSPQISDPFRQIAVFALMARRAFDGFVSENNGNPSALELYLLQWPEAAGTTLLADLQKAIDETAALYGAATAVLDDSQSAPVAIDKADRSGPGRSDSGSVLTNTGGDVIETQQRVAGTRTLPISLQLHDVLEYAGRKTGINVEVYSGGQPPSGPNRTGSHRHDVGEGRMGAADLFMRDAKTNRILNSDNAGDRTRMAAFIEESAAAGAIGIGHAPGYMGSTRTHIGGGPPQTDAVWGTGNSREGAPRWVIEAFERGRARALTANQFAEGLVRMRQAARPEPTGVREGSPGRYGAPPHAGGGTTEATGRRPTAASPETDAAIVEAANQFGFDPNTFRAIASIESSMDPASNRNRSTQYKGLFQIGREEWANFGSGGNIYSALDNAMAFGRMMRHHAEQFKSHFGRYPTDVQLYLMHQQGLGFYTRGVMTNVRGNPYPRMQGPQTSESFEAGWGRELMRRKAWFAGGRATETAAGAPEAIGAHDNN
jgi:hypothetical protein